MHGQLSAFPDVSNDVNGHPAPFSICVRRVQLKLFGISGQAAGRLNLGACSLHIDVPQGGLAAFLAYGPRAQYTERLAARCVAQHFEMIEQKASTSSAGGFMNSCEICTRPFPSRLWR